MLVEFASVVAAVECAAAIQVGLADRNRGVPSDERVEFRIGVNLDEVIADGADIFGDGVNIATGWRRSWPIRPAAKWASATSFKAPFVEAGGAFGSPRS